MYSDDFLMQIKGFGCLKYPIDRILLLISDDIDKNQLAMDFDDQDSDIAIAYKTGMVRSDFEIDQRLFEMAKSGDLKALAELRFRQRLM